MNKSVNRILTLTKRNIKEIIRDPLSLLFIIVMPLIMEIMFYVLFSSKTSQFEIKYLVPNIIVFGQSFFTLYVGLLVASDRNSSLLMRLFVTETKPYEFILGYILSIIPLSIVQCILLLIAGIILDYSILSIYILLMLMASIFTSQLFVGFGVLFGCICNEKSIGGIASIITVCQSILSGMWFPIEGISKNFELIMNILPFKNSSLILQNIINNNGKIIDNVINVLVYLLLIFILTVIVFKRKMVKK